MQHEILVVDDELGIRELLSEILIDEGYTVSIAENAEQANLYRQKRQPSMVLLDIWMPDRDGLTLLKEWVANGWLTMPVVMMSGHGSIEQAKEAQKLGAMGFMEKPITLQKLLETVGQALKQAQPGHALLDLSALGDDITHSAIKKSIQQHFNARSSFSLVGESGAGQQEILKALRGTVSSWVEVTSPNDLSTQPTRLFQQAKGGILWCPNIERYNAVQRKGLVFVLQQAKKHGVWVITSTAWPDALWAKRLDLKSDEWRILTNGRVVLPSVYSQMQSEPETVLERARKHRCPDSPAFSIQTEALEGLKKHPWWGGVVELEAVVMRLCAFSEEGLITASVLEHALTPDAIEVEKSAASEQHAQPSVDSQWFGLSLREARECFERTYFEYLLHRTTLGMSQIAERSGLERTHLYRKLKQLGINRDN
jgi:two-component system, NtrC family, nitrogen regulation response regulator NtrX